MARPVVWFLAGLLVAVVLLAGVMAGATYFSSGTDAQGHWEVKTWKGTYPDQGASINGGRYDEDKDRNFDDWVRLLGDDCELGPIYENGGFTALPYRCPS